MSDCVLVPHWTHRAEGQARAALFMQAGVLAKIDPLQIDGGICYGTTAAQKLLVHLLFGTLACLFGTG